MTDIDVSSSMSRWEWDRSLDAIATTVDRARRLRWISSLAIGAAAVGAGWFLTTGALRASAVIYGAAAGLAGGLAVRAWYVAVRARRAVAPVRRSIVPSLVPSATTAQLVSLVVNGGCLIRYLHVRAEPDDAIVRLTSSDLADRDWPRPGFFQLLFTGPDGAYYDDGSGTMARGADGETGTGGDGTDFSGGGGDVGGGDFGGGGN